MSAELLDRLAAAGTPMKLIMEVAEALADAKASARILEKRREKDRERKRNSKESAETEESAESRGTVSLDKESPHTPKKIISSEEVKSHRARKAGFDLPERIPAEPWAGFEEMRRRIGKPMTDRARQLAIIELDRLAEAGWPPGAVLNHCTMNSYQGIFPPKGQANGHRQSHPEHEWGRTVAAADSLIDELRAEAAQHG